MSFVSYSQNFEDVMLWRALKNVKGGFYIDVGANDPEIDSTTKAFYERGWCGINIEPLAVHYADLVHGRKRDVNLQCAAGAENGHVDIWSCDVRGWGTAAPEVVSRHAIEGRLGEFNKVPLRTLSAICDGYVNGEIHFLKIDVEGFEKEVIQGMDFTKYRPWILVIEATRPNTNEENHHEWEDDILSSNYLFVYGDGLNRFYVAGEHRELIDSFRYPPNVFDEYTRAEQMNWVRRAEQASLNSERAEAEAEQASIRAKEAEAKASWAEARIRTAELEASRATERAQTAEAEAAQTKILARITEVRLQQAELLISSIYRSRSWRISAPLRQISRICSRFVVVLHEKCSLLSMVGYLRVVAAHGEKWVSNRPRIKKYLLSFLSRTPRIKNIVRRFMSGLLSSVSSSPVYSFENKATNFQPHPSVLPLYPTTPETLLLSESIDAPARWVRLTGHIEGHYSLAIVNRGLANALEQENGQRLQFVPYHGQPYAETPVLPIQSANLQAALRRYLPPDEECKAISLVHHYPFITDPLPANLRYILFFWEETSVPSETIAHLNANFDAVVVAAESVKRALINSGCMPSVFVIPIGVDHLISAEVDPVDVLRVAGGQTLRFLHVSSVFDRKGADVLLAAYLDAFKSEDAVELYIKTFPNPHNNIRTRLKELCDGLDRPARVVIDETPLDDAGMLALYRSAHAMVLPTRGEGFNLPAAEAMAMGIPVITTGHSAQVDFCSRATATLLKYQFASSRSHLRASDACWLEPDVSDLTDKLRLLRQWIIDDSSALGAQRKAALTHVRSTYTWANSARALLASAEWLTSQLPSECGPLRVALVSPWDTRCGIAEYSKKLLCELIDRPEVRLSVYCDDRTVGASDSTLPRWTIGTNNSVVDVLNQISSSDAEVVLVQHQPSLFTLSDSCCDQLVALRRLGRVVILELHSTLPLLNECRVSPAAVSSLAELDRIIVHKPEDLNNLLALGLVDNVMLLNHGVIQPLCHPEENSTRAALGIPLDALVIGSFGFALEHKGIDTLVEAIKSLAQVNSRPVHLIAINSILDERSGEVIRRCQALAHELGVFDKISWITDYRPVEECQKLLCAADFVVFPYRHTRESASGAVTIGLATLKPVLVSPLDIFSDLPDVTWRMKGLDAEDIVQAVSTLAVQPSAMEALRERQQKWLRERDWSNLSARLLTVVRSLRRERRLASNIAEARQYSLSQWGASRRKQLLVDVSEMYHRDGRTGIQRVVRSVLKELLSTSPANYDVLPVYGSKAEGFRYTSKFHANGSSVPDEQLVEVGVGDIFLGLDLAAHLFPEAEQHLAKFRQAGARVYYVIYDIIPLRYPQFTVGGISQAFDMWLRGLASHADGLVCISDSVAKDVTAWFSDHVATNSLPKIGHFHLGADICNSAPTRGVPDNAPETLAMLGESVSFLMVGTIEPRKGHAQILDAFEQLWLSGLNYKLVLVGKQGWNMDAFADRLHSHSEFGLRLLWLESASDEYLESIYQQVDALIAASECEGFGLPLIEAAQHGVPIIARDIPVFREVAGGHAFYFNANNASEFVEAIDSWLSLQEADLHPRSRAMPWLNWHQSTAMLKNFIFDERNVR